MIKWIIVAGTMATGAAFTVGCFVGWKTTLKVLDSVERREKKRQENDQRT